MASILNSYTFGDMNIDYLLYESGNVEWIIYPAEMNDRVRLPERKKHDGIVQIKLVGDDYPKGFVTGTTMRNSQTTRDLHYRKQEKYENEEAVRIDTVLEDRHGNRVTHHATWYKGYPVIASAVTFENCIDQLQKIEMLSSFSLSNLSPFNHENQPGNLFLSRLRSKWGMEGRLERKSIEYYQLEPSWKPSGAGIEKYGQIGSMPVRGYFPYFCVEDEQHQVAWAGQLAHPGSWQIEWYRLDEDLCVSGGLADRDYGQWLKTIRSGESFTTPTALLTVCSGDLDDASDRLTAFQKRALKLREQPNEQKLPVMFNEFCTTWGNPTEATITRDLERLKDKKIDYYIIDAGWYADQTLGWERNMGEWEVNPQQFPNGIDLVVQKIKEAKLVPGIWFEVETVGRDASVFTLIDHLLKKDGVPITTGDRRFWDMRDPWVRDYLRKKIINFIQNGHFGYLKIDYNDNFGVGFDHADSLGEGNREQLSATQDFFREIHQQCPELVIENCSSGGHRLEPSMISLTDISSFSDAHETVSIPIIAANLHRVMLPQQSLVWAVLRKNDTKQRIFYSLINTFLGRMCLSGDIHELNSDQWKTIEDGIQFYNKIKPIVRDGKTYRYGKPVLSYRNPVGTQGIVRYHTEKKEALIIVHCFKEGRRIHLPLNFKKYTLIDSFGQNQQIKIEENEFGIEFTFSEDYQAVALIISET
ncbi:alpha-galactosidase [Sporolactobacillus shoreicorticis]|uniref:Glycoside hydrolase family 36 protein n=1 Tax=Sporolactobacillus shoreicorticis TaxID=1923877 RepID=A0ABW5S1B6_9BACL|nr:glycoside hydrolase family 36 protein [Sporolactobacillus shoreicorticis]MCO7124689.1 alpha-galactosidase [Sporolactobacillus shoreicorticis]